LIEIRLKKAIENATLYLFPFTLPLKRTDFILKITTRIREEMLLNGMKILNFRTDFIIWKELGEWA
jgi:hypothetical protein